MQKRDQVKWVSLILTVMLFVLAFGLRFYALAQRAPFDWDQNRDYSQVEQIAHGKYIALGPVAKGVGGFYLGSLYYYLLTPAYLFLRGDLISLPLTSIILDALVGGLLYLLLNKYLGKRTSLAAALLWSTTWLLIEASRISWNVSLVPLWSLLTIYSLTAVIERQSIKHFYLLALLAGLTLHIHVTTFVVIPLLLVFFWRRLHFSPTTWIKAICIGLIPVLPLAIYDLNHSFYNLHLLRDFLTYRSRVDTTYLSMVSVSLTKLGKVVSGIFIANFRDSLALGIATLTLAVFACFKREFVIKISGLMVILATFLIILFRDYTFPEYYFGFAYLPLILVIIHVFFVRLKSIGYLVVLAFIVLNLRAYTAVPTGFSLSNKRAIVTSLKDLAGPIDMSYSFDPGRDGGLRQLISIEGIALDPQSKYRVLLTDKLNTPLYIDGELAHDLTQIGSLKSALYIVQ